MRHLHAVAPRPPSTPDEMDDPMHDVLAALGRLAALLLLLIVVCVATAGLLLQEPLATMATVQVTR